MSEEAALQTGTAAQGSPDQKSLDYSHNSTAPTDVGSHVKKTMRKSSQLRSQRDHSQPTSLWLS